MNKFFILTALICTFANAQEIRELRKPVKCSDTKWVMNHFSKEYGEMPSWFSKTDAGTELVILSNKETNTWTLIEFSDDTACVLNTGKSNNPI